MSQRHVEFFFRGRPNYGCIAMCVCGRGGVVILYHIYVYICVSYVMYIYIMYHIYNSKLHL